MSEVIRVVARFGDGKVLKGTTQDFSRIFRNFTCTQPHSVNRLWVGSGRNRREMSNFSPLPKLPAR